MDIPDFMKVIIKILITFFCLLIACAVEAQIGVKRKIFYDFRVGVNSSEMDVENGNYGKRPKIGFHIGFLTSYKFYDGFQVQTGAFLTKKGMKRKYDDTVEDAPPSINIRQHNIMYTYDANYFQVPLMLGWESKDFKSWQFNINAGIYGAWGFRGETKGRGSVYTNTGSITGTERVNVKYDTFSKSVLKKFDYGMIGSIGVVYEIYTVNLTYEYGLYNISNGFELYSNSGRKGKVLDNLRNRNLTFSVGFRF